MPSLRLFEDGIQAWPLNPSYASLSRRINPSFSYNSHHDDDQTNHQDSSRSMIDTYLTQRRCFGSCINNISCQFTGAFRRTGYGCVGNGLILNRYMSTSFGEADTTNFPSEVPLRL